MPVWLLIGIPIVVAVIMFGILTLPDEEDEGKTDEKSEKKEATPKPRAKKKTAKIT